MILQIWQSTPTIAQQIIIPVIAGIILYALVFPVRKFITKSPEREKKREEKLRIHFEDISKEVINHISEMARSLAIRHERLVTSYAPISESYDFEKKETHKAFELHFPEEAKEWKELNNKAVEHNKRLIDFFQRFQHLDGNGLQNLANDDIKDLQHEYSNFSQRLVTKVASMDKYGIGTEFKKLKNCPICQKF